MIRFLFDKVTVSDNLNNREGQTDSTPAEKYNFTLTTEGLWCYYKFQFHFVIKIYKKIIKMYS